jgi:hypothetical protein
MDNMELYAQFKDTPKEAQKTIKGGRLNGFTDINPMWRIRRLTEVFGACGIGWKYEVTNTQIIPGSDGTVAAFVDINLYYKTCGEWSEGIPGMGGSMFVAKEKGGLYTSDECFKMALTDAIGTACKALGMSEDIYFANGKSKYTREEDDQQPKLETFEDAKAYVFTFGQYKGKTLEEVWLNDFGYVKWLSTNEKTDPIILKAIGIISEASRASRCQN